MGGVTISADSGPCLHFVLSLIVKCVKSQDSRNLAMNGFEKIGMYIPYEMIKHRQSISMVLAASVT